MMTFVNGRSWAGLAWAWALTGQILATPLWSQEARQDRVVSLLRELSLAAGPSGFEGPVRAILSREFRTAGLEVSNDGMGSIIGVLPGPAGSPRIMLAAHMDEVGAIVKYVTTDGMIKIHLLGGWLDQNLVDQAWTIVTDKGPVSAISGQRSPHITPAEDRNRVTPRDDVFLDVGARSKAEVDGLGIKAGDPIVPRSEFYQMANGRYVGKAMDDRVGCVMMLEAMSRLKTKKLNATIYFVGTVQEEIGLRGARSATALIKPDLGISVEAGIAGDHPGGRPDFTQERLGAGPVLYLADAAMLVNQNLRAFFERVARDKGIPVQTEITGGGAEDAAEMQRWDSGRPSINFAVAVRYLHGHHAMVERKDIDQSIDLLTAAVAQLDQATVKAISSFQ
jgi:endoglucanase